MIKWLDEYTTGVYLLDQQHKELFSYCNDLERILEDGDLTPQMVQQGVKFLEKYIKNHFSQEETCMHQYACPIAGKNKVAHQKFIQAYKMMEKKIDQGEDSYLVLRKLHTFLESWLKEHICKIDTHLKACVYR